MIFTLGFFFRRLSDLKGVDWRNPELRFARNEEFKGVASRGLALMYIFYIVSYLSLFGLCLCLLGVAVDRFTLFVL